MFQDPIVDEVHQARAQILAQYQGKFESYFAALLQTQNESQRLHPERYVSFELQNILDQTDNAKPQVGDQHIAR